MTKGSTSLLTSIGLRMLKDWSNVVNSWTVLLEPTSWST